MKEQGAADPTNGSTKVLDSHPQQEREQNDTSPTSPLRFIERKKGRL